MPNAYGENRKLVSAISPGARPDKSPAARGTVKTMSRMRNVCMTDTIVTLADFTSSEINTICDKPPGIEPSNAVDIVTRVIR